jgi:hypothetical protein
MFEKWLVDFYVYLIMVSNFALVVACIVVPLLLGLALHAVWFLLYIITIPAGLASVKLLWRGC